MSLDLLAGPWGVQNHPRGQYWQRNVVVDGKQRLLLQHRVVMEMIVGRPLLSSEHVHHRDGNGLNNEPYNLQLMSCGQHRRLHLTQRYAVRKRALALAFDRIDAIRYRHEILTEAAA